MHVFLAEFFRKHSTIKDFSTRRVPYHYEQAGMSTELVAFLRSTESRHIGRTDRQTYLRVSIFMVHEVRISFVYFRDFVARKTFLHMTVY